MRRSIFTTAPFGVWLMGLLVIFTSGCHLLFPYGDMEHQPVIDVLVFPQQDGEPPKPQVDLGISPDTLPVNTCLPESLLRDDFESEAFSRGQWSLEKITGGGDVFITSQSDGSFSSVPVPDTPRYMYFAPANSCCHDGCKGANQLALVSRPMELRSCDGIKVGLYFITGAMELDQDSLSLEYRTLDGNWRVAVSLYPEIKRTPQEWTRWQGEITGLKGKQQVQVRVRHSSQCNDDIAAIDVVKISRY